MLKTMTGYQGTDGRFVRVPIEQRFWTKVDKSAGRNACWLWTGAVESTGYGRITDYWTKYSAHRMAYELTYGPITNGLHVCHKCDNRLCVNPKHLWLGDRVANMQDASRKGRMSRTGNPKPKRGINAQNAKLTNAQVRAIRATASKRKTLSRAGVRKGEISPTSVRGLATKYGVAPSLIQRIIKGESWTHVK